MAIQINIKIKGEGGQDQYCHVGLTVVNGGGGGVSEIYELHDGEVMEI